jgi:parallel beta-helix repeat protein
MTSTVTVAGNVTLTVEAGVRIELGQSVNLEVLGSLQAIGSDVRPILFTNAVGATSGGLRFYGSSPAALCTGILSHCEIVKLAGYPVLDSSYADLRIEYCTFRDHPCTVINPHNSRLWIVGNTMSNTAEAINAVSCAGVIASNRITKINGYADAIDLDLAWTGGGDTTMLLLRNELSDAADVDADGIDFGTSPGVADGNIIRNFADKGISIGETSPSLVRNNLIIGCNIGIAIKDSSAPDLQNNTVVGCVYGIKSSPKYTAYGGRGTMTNSIIWNCATSLALLGDSTLAVGYSDVQGTNVWPGVGNMMSPPAFVNPAAGDYRLATNAPCIDAGTNGEWMQSATDLDGKPRIIHGTVDLGAYEAIKPEWDSNSNGIPDWWEWQHSRSLTNMSATADDDNDGADNLAEYRADTDPANSNSCLEITGFQRTSQGLRVDWTGGTGAWQYLECRRDLLATSEQWTAISTSPPPTAVMTNVVDAGATNAALFYRVRAMR